MVHEQVFLNRELGRWGVQGGGGGGGGGGGLALLLFNFFKVYHFYI